MHEEVITWLEVPDQGLFSMGTPRFPCKYTVVHPGMVDVSPKMSARWHHS